MTDTPRGKPAFDPLQVVAIVGYFIFIVLTAVLHIPLLPSLVSKVVVSVVMAIMGCISVALYVYCARSTSIDRTEEILEEDRKARDAALVKRKERNDRIAAAGGIASAPHEEEVVLPSPTIPEADVRYCVRCERDVHHETKHCMVCNKCCVNFDHHCKWLNNCIGGENYKAFFIFVAVTFVVIVAYTGLGAYHIIQYFIDDGKMKTELDKTYNAKDNESWAHIVVISVMCVVELLGVIAVALLFHLLAIHVYLIHRGITTYAWILEKRARQINELTEREALGITPAFWHESCHDCVVDAHNRKSHRTEDSFTPGEDNATYTTPEGYDNSLANVLDLEMGGRSELEGNGSSPLPKEHSIISDTPSVVREQHPDRPQSPGDTTPRGGGPAALFGSQYSASDSAYSPTLPRVRRGSLVRKSTSTPGGM